MFVYKVMDNVLSVCPVSAKVRNYFVSLPIFPSLFFLKKEISGEWDSLPLTRFRRSCGRHVTDGKNIGDVNLSPWAVALRFFVVYLS